MLTKPQQDQFLLELFEHLHKGECNTEIGFWLASYVANQSDLLDVIRRLHNSLKKTAQELIIVDRVEMNSAERNVCNFLCQDHIIHYSREDDRYNLIR